MAAPDNCSPRKTTVVIDQPKEHNHLFWPSCTRVMKCGGCSGHESQVCVPTSRGKTKTKINVSSKCFCFLTFFHDIINLNKIMANFCI